jgi:hypothetical protein
MDSTGAAVKADSGKDSEYESLSSGSETVITDSASLSGMRTG